MRVEKSLVGSAPNEFAVRVRVRLEAERTWRIGVDRYRKGNTLHQPQDGAQETGTRLTARSRMALRNPKMHD